MGTFCTFCGYINWYNHYEEQYGDSLKKNRNKLPCDPAIQPLCIYPLETIIEEDMFTLIFIVSLFATARTWKQPRCPLTDEWKNMLYIYTMEYYSDIKKVHIWVSSSEVDEPTVYCTEWSNSEREKLLLSIIAYIWNLENSTDEWIFRAAKEDVNIKNRLLDRVEEGEGGIIWESIMKHIHCHSKIHRQWEFALRCREPKSGALWKPKEMGWGRRWQGGSTRCGPSYTYGWFTLMYCKN